MRTTTIEQLHYQPAVATEPIPGRMTSIETPSYGGYLGDPDPLEAAFYADPLNTDIPLPVTEQTKQASVFDSMIGDSGIIIPESAPLIGYFDNQSIVDTPIHTSITQELAAITNPDAVARELGIASAESAKPVAPRKTQPFIKVPVAPGNIAQTYVFSGSTAKGKVPMPRTQVAQQAPEETLSLEDMKKATRIFPKSDAEGLPMSEQTEASMDGHAEPLYGSEQHVAEVPESVRKLHETVARAAQLNGVSPAEAHDTATDVLKAVGANQDAIAWADLLRPKDMPQTHAKERRSFGEKVRSGMERVVSSRKVRAIGVLALTAGIMFGTAEPTGDAPARSAASIGVEAPQHTAIIDAGVAPKAEVSKPSAEAVAQPKVVEAQKQDDVMQVKLPKYNAKTQAGTPWKAAETMLEQAGEKNPSDPQINKLAAILVKNAGVSMKHADQLQQGAMLQAARDQVERIMNVDDDEEADA